MNDRDQLGSKEVFQVGEYLDSFVTSWTRIVHRHSSQAKLDTVGYLP